MRLPMSLVTSYRVNLASARAFVHGSAEAPATVAVATMNRRRVRSMSTISRAKNDYSAEVASANAYRGFVER
jgi:hypothetical protein